MPSARPRLTARLSRALQRFHSEETGAFIVWALFMVVAILVATGVGITTQLYEYHRTHLQNTLDNAVLAATDLEQSRTPQNVVEDYLARAGLGEALGRTRISDGVNFRTTYASADFNISTFFVPGTSEWEVVARSEASEAREHIEVSLVLDISGTMRFDNRIAALRVAANDFIDTMLDGDRVDGTTISIVPYSGQVNPGPLMFDELGGTRDHDASSCLFVENDDFTHTGLPKFSSRQVPNFMKWTIAPDFMDWGWCPSDTTSIRYLSNDADALKDFINTMRQHDGTGTHYGMKYGLALLDPASEDALDTLQAAGQLPDIAHNRPAPWGDAGTMKVVVLMTDGMITEQFEPKHTGLRDIDDDDDDNETGDRDDIDGIDHDILNAEVETNNQGSIGGDKLVLSRSTNLSNFYKVCDAAKEKDVLVFTIAFEAPSGATDEMRNCATSPTHFYEVDQLEISAAFASIARQINQLRLTM